MPNYNRWANQYTLLTQYYAITHPSLSNYLAMIGGSTFGVDYSCYDCYQNAYTLVDLIEDSGRTWKTYQEDMPRPCFDGNEYKNYTKRHNPFVYFDSIRLDPERCERSVVPFEQLAVDLAAGALPDFVFIMPNQCHNAHDCPLNEADAWLGEWAPFLLAYPDFVQGGLIVLTWDEGQGNHACCGMTVGGGRVATVLMSPLVKPGFQDETPYTHYSLLKTISEAWGLPYLGHAADPEHALITLPWLR
jgi:phospholipase C